MEQGKKVKVLYKKNAAFSIARIAWYITGKGYPDTAQKYRRRLYAFGNSLSLFSDKYPLCRHLVYSTRKYHCAVFDKTWVFIYKLEKNQLIVYHVIHSALLA